MNLSHIPNSEIARLYNAVADKPVASFSDRTTGLRLLKRILTERGYRVVEDEVGLSVEQLPAWPLKDARAEIADLPEDGAQVVEAPTPATPIAEKVHAPDGPMPADRPTDPVGRASPPALDHSPAASGPSAPISPRPGSKNAIMISMVATETGATEAEICARIGWKSCAVTLKRACTRAGLTLSRVKVPGSRCRYIARPAA